MRLAIFVILALVAGLFASAYYMGDANITGFVPMDLSEETVMMAIDRTSTFSLETVEIQNLESLMISGQVVGDGEVNVYLDNGNGKRLLVYTNKEYYESNLITGMQSKKDWAHNKTTGNDADKENKGKKDEAPGNKKKDEGLSLQQGESIEASGNENQEQDDTDPDSKKDEAPGQVKKSQAGGSSEGTSGASAGQSSGGSENYRPIGEVGTNLKLIPVETVSENIAEDKDEGTAPVEDIEEDGDDRPLLQKMGDALAGKPPKPLIEANAVLEYECIETCALPNDDESYTLLFEVTPGTVFRLDSIIYSQYD